MAVSRRSANVSLSTQIRPSAKGENRRSMKDEMGVVCVRGAADDCGFNTLEFHSVDSSRSDGRASDFAQPHRAANALPGKMEFSLHT